eukprot:scaffold5834_cov376-Prasinococcus_capsulatus_cf.AAC.4
MHTKPSLFQNRRPSRDWRAMPPDRVYAPVQAGAACGRAHGAPIFHPLCIILHRVHVCDNTCNLTTIPCGAEHATPDRSGATWGRARNPGEGCGPAVLDR